VWEERIHDYLTNGFAYIDGTAKSPPTRVTIGDVAHHLGFEPARIGTADQRRIAAVLTNLGWERETTESGKLKVSWDGKRWWIRK